MNARIQKRVEQAIRERVFPGCVIGTIIGRELKISSFGSLTYMEDARCTNGFTPYDIASISKGITGTLLLRLVDDKIVEFNDPVSHYLPEYREKTSVWNLLAGNVNLNIPSLKSIVVSGKPESILNPVMEATSRKEVVSERKAFNVIALLEGLIIERVLEMPLDQALSLYFFSPLFMRQITHKPLAIFKKDCIAPTEIIRERGIIQGSVHDEVAYALQPCALGYTGLFSTCCDILLFVDMLLSRGTKHNRAYLSKSIIERMIEEPLGLAWDSANPRFMREEEMGRKGVLGLVGFTGCSVLFDIPQHTGIVILSNRTWPKRKINKDGTNDSSDINAVRREIAGIVFDTMPKKKIKKT